MRARGESSLAVPPPVEPAGAGFIERWWQGETGGWGRVLDVATAPLELVYRLGAGGYHRAYTSGRLRPAQAEIPVISVGNLSVGGTGKTPVTRWLVEELRRRGAKPAVLHGGYAEDEPALHRSWYPDVPVIVDRDRVRGARAAADQGASVIVLDDGFQHRRLARDLDVVLIAAEGWTDRPRLLPRGPWREPLGALRRAHVIAVTWKTAGPETTRRIVQELGWLAPRAIRLTLQLRPSRWRRVDGPAVDDAPAGRALAVAAIARPELFVANARERGAEVDEIVVFRDHHVYRADDVERIRTLARGRPVVTTAKDAVKLRPLARDLDLWVLEQEVVVEDGFAALERRLDRLVS